MNMSHLLFHCSSLIILVDLFLFASCGCIIKVPLFINSSVIYHFYFTPQFLILKFLFLFSQLSFLRT
jgi:hypothetical protein